MNAGAKGVDLSAAERVLARLEDATPEQPVRLGRYEVVRRLGRGGMGSVFEALDRERKIRVALKTLHASDPAAGVQLKREFRAVSDLAHPNLAHVYELASEDGLWFFAMELVEGVDFRQWWRRDEPESYESGATTIREAGPTLPDVTAQRLDLAAPTPALDTGEPTPTFRVDDADALRRALLDLVHGVGALHDAGLRHGDIKPKNVLVRQDGRVVVVDFGLVRPVGPVSPLGPLSGTPAYMPPEQITGGDAGPASDWYSVGTMLYELLTGRLPFAGNDLVDLYEQKTTRAPRPPHEIVPGVPRDLSDVCMRLLRPEPAWRPDEKELVSVLSGDSAPTSTPDGAGRHVFIGRVEEVEQLRRAHRKAASRRCVVAHVHGPSGIGKSTVVRSFLASLGTGDSEVLRGRCYERESVPYKAFDGIVDELTTRLLQLGERATSMLPEWTPELGRVFTTLSAVPAVASRGDPAPSLEAKELRRRAWVALEELFDAIAESRVLVLWIDDLQWADEDSARLLESLLRRERTTPLLVIASFRSSEASHNRALADYFEGVARRGDDALVDIELDALPPAEAERLARSVLEADSPGRASDELARDIAREAGGVPFFIEELSRFVATGGQAFRDAGVSLEEAIGARIEALPSQQRALVEVVAVAGHPIAQSVVFRAAGLDAEALPALLSLRGASILAWTGPSASDPVSTYHDRIRESVLASLSAASRAAHHLALARTLTEEHAASKPGPWLFDAVRHFAAGSDSLTDPAERRTAARLHLAAGRAARDAAAFPLAFDCFEGGIALLPKSAWQDDYETSLGLHVGAAEAAYLSAEWDALDRRVQDVKAHGRSTMDQLLAWEVQIDALSGRHDYVAAIDVAMEVLELLDVKLPSDPGPAQIGAAATTALESLNRIGTTRFESLPDVDDPRVAAAMRIQVRLSPAAYFGRPTLLPIIAANLVKTSVERGLSSATPYALALFGIVLNTMGLYPIAHEWGQLALRLLERAPDRSLEAATRHVLFNLVCAWMVPLSSTLEPLREVFDIGRRTGDLEYASYAAHGWAHSSMYCGRPLGPLLDEALELGAAMRDFGQVNAVHVHAPFEQLLKCWTGRKENPATLNDASYDENAELELAAKEGSRSGIFVVRLVMGLARYHFGSAKDASACFEIARGYLDAGPSVWHIPILHQFAALAGCAAWDDLDDAERAALRPKIDASLAELRTLAGFAPVNFAHRVSLVEGAIAAIEGRTARALELFETGVEQAREADFVPDIALAYELWAHYQPDEAAARASLERARDTYAAWGASAKAQRLSERLG